MKAITITFSVITILTAILTITVAWRMNRMEQQQYRIIHLQQQAIKKANTIADVGKKTEKGKRKTAAFNNNAKINSTEHEQ